MIYRVRLLPEAEDDLFEIYRYIARKASPAVALGYVNRIKTYIAGFQHFPERGTIREEMRSGLRIVGFERRISIAFSVVGGEVIIIRVLYAGRQFPAP